MAESGSPGGVEPERIAALGIRAVLQLIARALATRIVTLLGTIALARLLTPEEFGTFALVMFVVVLFTLVGDTGIGGALIQQAHPPTERELATAMTFQVVIWTVVLVAIWAVAAALPVLAPELPSSSATLARMLGVAAWLNGVRAIPSAMLARAIRFGPIALVEIVQQVVYFGFAVALAASGFGVLSFGIATVAQSLVATTCLWLVFGRWPGLGFDLAVIRRMWVFGLSYQLSYVLYWIRDSAVAVLGGLAGGLQAIGYIQFGWRNGQFAVSIEEIIARVAFPAFSRLQADAPRLGAMAVVAIESSFLAIAVIQGWLAATAPTLVPIVFSDQWIPAVDVFRLVCIGSLAWGPVLILRALIYARGESGLGLGLAAFSVAALYVIMPVLSISMGLTGAGIAIAVSSLVALVAYVWASRAALEFPWLSIGRILVETAVAGAAASLAVQAIGGVAGLLVSGIAYLAVFAILIAGFERSLVRQLFKLNSSRSAAASPGQPR